jgi:rubredoxin
MKISYLYGCPKCEAVTTVRFKVGGSAKKVVLCGNCSYVYTAELSTMQGGISPGGRAVGFTTKRKNPHIVRIII